MAEDPERALQALERRARRERAARLVAEELLEKKSLELFEANRRLASLNETLESRVKERTRMLERERRRALDLAEKDHLTRLANRHSYTETFRKAVAEAGEGGRAFALILVDLDGFKQLNDTYGHAAGDAMLKTAANRIRDIVRTSDLVARLGGDEFAIIAFDVTDESTLVHFTERLLDAVQSPITYGKRQIRCGASLGTAFCPEHAANPQELQRFADLALYQAKASGRGIAVTFDPQLAEAHFMRATMGEELKTALARRDVEIFFQPVLDLTDQSLSGLEALVRWNHESRGWISPLDILAIAEEQGQLSTLTRYIIRETLTQVRDVIARRVIDWVSINLTDHDLRDCPLIDFIIDTLEETDVAPHHVKFEITEHTVISDAENACRVISLLSERGAHFAIDDFGTGYSNLLTLNRLPFHTLKIDQTFIADIAGDVEAETIVKAMIDLGHALNLSVVAEGIETPQQLALLQMLGCNFGQGYLFGRPQPLDQVMAVAKAASTHPGKAKGIPKPKLAGLERHAG